jgi:hypothetical protein
MEPVSIILAALAAGAAKVGAGAAQGLSEAARDSVAGLYARLKAAIVGRAGTQDPGAAKTLERHASNPEGYEVVVRDVLVESGVDGDAAVLELARELLREAEPERFEAGVYSVTLTAGATGSGRVYQAGRDLKIHER